MSAELSPPLAPLSPVPPIEDLSPNAAWGTDVHRAYLYWAAKWSPGRLPGRGDIDPLEFPDLWRGVWLMDVAYRPFKLRYRLVGTLIVEAIGFDPTGRDLDDAHPHVRQTPGFFARYERAAASGTPSRRRGTALLWRHNDFREVENVLLPFASDGRTVDMIMMYTSVLRANGSRVR